MKTPDKIKKGLEACSASGGCRICPYHELGSGKKCIPAVSSDALAYIRQLEAENTKETETNAD